MQSKLSEQEMSVVNNLYKYRDNTSRIKEIEEEIKVLNKEHEQLSKMQYSIEQSMPVGNNIRELYIRMDENELAVIKYLEGERKQITITKMLEANS